MIRAVAVDIGSPQKTIPDVAKTFSFIGDGTASEVLSCARVRVASANIGTIRTTYTGHHQAERAPSYSCTRLID